MKKLLVLAALTLPSLVAAGATADTLDKSYTLEAKAGPTVHGKKAVATVDVKPGPGFHMNKEYPTSLKLKAPEGVTLVKDKLAKADAVKWEESEGRFEVGFTATKPGKQVITGDLSFAVCSANSCDPKKQTVSIEIDAK